MEYLSQCGPWGSDTVVASYRWSQGEDIQKEHALNNTDIQLLRACVFQRFLDGHSNAIVLALEGFKWIRGEESAVTRESLEEEKDEND